MSTRVAGLLLLQIFLQVSACGLDLPAPLNDEVLGLVVFKAALEDPTSALASWNEADETPCSWAHVRCDPTTSRVVGLALDSLSLSGPLPRGLDRLPALASLSLSDNNLSGPLASPPDLISLLPPALRYLDLSRNAFSGDVPALLPSLRSLDLSSNALSGALPERLFSDASCGALRFLSLAGNLLEGPLPYALSRCSFLLHLNLSGNRFSGEPDFAAGLWSLSRLRVLDLSLNSFSGGVPDGIAKLHSLRSLRFNGNRFSGPIPAGAGLCPHLTSLDLSDNLFDGALPHSIQFLTSLTSLSSSNNRLSGDVPPWIGKLTVLRYLDLSNSGLAGAIPESIAGCTKLAELHLKGNGLTGGIPRGLFDLGLQVLDLSANELAGTMLAGSTRMPETLRSLDLSDNNFTGSIPPELVSYSGLRYLNLSWNNFRSQLPPELASSPNLSVLDLRSNALYGSIPGELCESGSLSVLQLDDNSLTGPIPEEIGNCSSLYLLSLSRNSLNGSIPASLSELKKLEILKLEFNNLIGEIPPQLGNLDNLLDVNISHNQLVGRLPAAGIFQSLDGSALQGNLGLCTPLVAEPCKMNVPKPLVLDPNAYIHGNDTHKPAAGVDSATVTVAQKKFLSVSAIVAISAAVVIILGVVVVTLLNISARRRKNEPVENALESRRSSSMNSSGPAVGKIVLLGDGGNLRSSEDMLGGSEALLSKAAKLGSGVFGTVYRASVGDGSVAVAIKKLSTENLVQYHDDFDREIRALANVAHPNLMQLKGYYWTPQLQLLISDYARHGSLHARLYESTAPPLPWADRFRIALGAAKGLAHLHEAFRPPIIHYNLKPTNVLLDEDGEPKVSDFGLARLLQKFDEQHAGGTGRSHGATGRGYAAPEVACRSVRVNEKCDVYGFGVVMLELVTGKKPVEYGEDDVVILIDHVRAAVEQGNAAECVDASMGEAPEEEVLPVLKVGLVCTSQVPSSRPSMAEVVQVLQVIKAPL